MIGIVGRSFQLYSWYSVCRRGDAAKSVPFAYPIHYAPFDLQRMTPYQLSQKFESAKETSYALESAALLGNLALARIVGDRIRCRKPAALLLPLIASQVPLSNLLGWLSIKLAGDCGRGFLPLGYQPYRNKSA